MNKIIEQTNTNDLLDVQLEDDIQNHFLFGRGVFYLSLSMTPPAIVRLAKIAAGMQADQALGLKLLYQCINTKNGVRVPVALLFVLFWLLIYIPEFVPGKEERYREASELIKFGSYYYKQSVFFYWLQSYMELKKGNISQALLLLDKAMASCNNLSKEPSRLAFEKG